MLLPYGHLLGHFWSLRAAGPHSLVWKITTNHCAEQRKIIQKTGLKQHKGQSFWVDCSQKLDKRFDWNPLFPVMLKKEVHIQCGACVEANTFFCKT